MSWDSIEAGALMAKRGGSVDPRSFPDETFELYSIPAFDKGSPAVVKGSEIGSAKPLVEPNDVMISRIVPHIRRSTVVRPNSGLRQIASSEWIIFRDPRIHPDYLRHYLVSDEFNTGFMSTVAGVGGSLLRARPAAVAKIRVPLPPLDEQRRIAEVLDRADALRKKRRRALQKLDTLLQSVFIDMFGDPAANPKGWPTSDLGTIADFVGGGTPRRELEQYYDGIICWATSKDMKGRFLLDTQEHITEEAISNSATKLVPTETILVVVKSKILMKRLPVLIAKVPTCFGQDLKGILLHDKQIVTYVAQSLIIGQNSLLKQARGINTEGLTLDHLRKFKVMMPPRDQIEKFTHIVQHILGLIELAGAHLKESESLFHSLQWRAFKGGLSSGSVASLDLEPQTNGNKLRILKNRMA